MQLNAERLSREGVGSSDPKQQVPLRGIDIVYSAWRHAAVHQRTGRELTNSIEY